MQWSQSLRRKVLGGEADARLHAFLRRHIRPFKATADAKAWRAEAGRLRRELIARVYQHGHGRAWFNARPNVVWTDTLKPDPAYVIRKLRIEAYPDYWVPALLYEPTGLRQPAPVVLNPNGHHAGGNAILYKQARCINLARRGILALSIEFIGMGELEADCDHDQFAMLDMTGLGSVGLFYLALKKSMDVLLAHRRADPRRTAVTGLSGGGWQTIVFCALDTRARVSVPVAGYTTVRARIGCFNDIGDLEQVPPDFAAIADYSHLTAMLAPRPALVILNSKDECCFRTDRAKPVIYDPVRPVYRAAGAADRFAFHNNIDPGTHNYDADNRSQLYRFLNRHFGLSAPVHDLHTERELLPARRLGVGLPPRQRTMHGLAVERCDQLERTRRTPRTAAARRKLRDRLAGVLRLPEDTASGRRVAGTARAGVYKLRIGPLWVPVSHATGREKSHEARLYLSDLGRAGDRELRRAPAVTTYAADILGTGENSHDLRHLLLIDSVGHRLLGVRVAQVIALAQWLRRSRGVRRVRLEACGVSTSLTALIAAALRPRLFHSLTTWGELGAVRHLIDRRLPYAAHQTMFCPDLLTVCDTAELEALLEGVAYRRPGRNVLDLPA